MATATPLFIAAYNGHLEMARALLEAGADVNKANSNDCTPLYAAAKEGHLEMVRLLCGF
jgi:ankyrin repeat protein